MHNFFGRVILFFFQFLFVFNIFMEMCLGGCSGLIERSVTLMFGIFISFLLQIWNFNVFFQDFFCFKVVA